MEPNMLYGTVEILGIAGEPIMTFRAEAPMERLERAAQACLAIMPHADHARVSEMLPWGDVIAHSIYRGQYGVEIQVEMFDGRT